MFNKTSQFGTSLQGGKPQLIVVLGTSLSYHLAPILRSALQSRFGDMASVINAGMAGRASRTGLEQLDDKVIRHNPDTVLIEFAINDAHDYHHEPEALDQGIESRESRENLEAMIARIKELVPKAEVILWTTNETWDVEGSTMHGRSARPHLESYYQGIREVASARGLKLIDGEKFWDSLHNRLGDDFRALIPDGVHPTPKALREYFVPFLLEELGVPEQTL